MQPLVRFVPRLVFDSIASLPALRATRIPSRPSFRPSICLQCRVRSQVRRYADDSKPSNPPKPADPPKLTEAPESSNHASLSEEVTEELPSAEESRRTQVGKRFSHLMDNLQGNIFIASQRLNDLTGYSGIEALKSRITTLERRVQDAQEAVRASRITYKTTVADRAATQREVTTLLARKDSWTPADLERFTSLYRMDHSNEQAVQEAATRLADTEREAEHCASKLSSSILSRYHEEQIWSDKIRRMSTWGTWGLMGVNVLLFFAFQFGFEPWRRARLVHGFEEKVREALEKENSARAEKKDGKRADVLEVPLDGVLAAGVQELQNEMDDDPRNPDPAVDAVVACIQGNVGQQEVEAKMDIAEMYVPRDAFQLKKIDMWKAALLDLFSERLISMRKQDVAVVALEGAATGAAIGGIIATIILRHL